MHAAGGVSRLLLHVTWSAWPVNGVPQSQMIVGVLLILAAFSGHHSAKGHGGGRTYLSQYTSFRHLFASHDSWLGSCDHLVIQTPCYSVLLLLKCNLIIAQMPLSIASTLSTFLTPYNSNWNPLFLFLFLDRCWTVPEGHNSYITRFILDLIVAHMHVNLSNQIANSAT